VTQATSTISATRLTDGQWQPRASWTFSMDGSGKQREMEKVERTPPFNDEFFFIILLFIHDIFI
jgi:hypothetical protein